jgi:hypothetical protein
MTTTVDDRLRHVATKSPLVFDDVDFTVNDPEALRDMLAAPLEYAQRVEAAVVTSGIETLLPRRDARIDEFLELWTSDEHGHARALGELMRQLDLEPQPIGEAPLPLHNRILGRVAARSESVHEMIATIWGVAGAMNEHLAMAAYTRIGAILQARGERALHETLFRRLRAHESAHKNFYVAIAVEGWERLDQWQRRLVRLVVTKTYAPVGAGEAKDRPAMARTIHALAADEWEPSIVQPVQGVADRLLHLDPGADPFVRRAFACCLAADPRGAQLLALAETP